MKQLAEGTYEKRDELDEKLETCTMGRSLSSQAVVDRNVLRLATYEINYFEDIPNAVTINEAVELAQKYSTAESGKFINGVLSNFME